MKNKIMKNKVFNFKIGFPIAFILLAFTLFSCDAQKSTTATNSNPDHSAKNALDYDGIYRGTIPCADCEGIKATVYLMRNNTFKTVYEYLGKDNVPFETSGKFTWNKEGNTVMLKSGNEKTSYFVGENTLTQLNQDGSKITGALASKYMLTKDNYNILNRKWKLVELLGKPVNNSMTMNKDAFIQFSDKENRYSAFAGCNTISGNFKTESFNRLKLSMGISTMMSCENMTLENELKEVLNTADGFQFDGQNLILIRAKMSPLAKFVAPVNE